MSVLSLERRLRKVEAARGRKGADAFFLIWARDQSDAERALADLERSIRPDLLTVARWDFPDEAPPRPRWTTCRELSDRELDTLLDQLLADVEHEAPEEAARIRATRCRLTDDELGKIAFGGMRA